MFYVHPRLVRAPIDARLVSLPATDKALVYLPNGLRARK